MDTGFYIALRYLFAKKSHNVINVISAISAAGMAVGTAALVLILSVYNGFNEIIEQNISDLDPDILVAPVTGKRFVPDSTTLAILEADPRILSLSCILKEDVYISYGESQGIATAMGVDSAFVKDSPLAAHVTSGEFSLHKGQLEMAAIGVGLAYEMGINPRFLEKIRLYYPRKGASVPLAGLASSLNGVSLIPSCLFSINTTVDAGTVILPIEAMRRLLDEAEAVSGIEIRADSDDVTGLMSDLRSVLGPEFKLLDRYMQRPAIYKMMRYEKMAIYCILLFVVIIVAFNIFGSLSLLRIEKARDVGTLRAMGAGDRLIRRIFLLEGWMISLLGLATGMVVGVGAAFLQEHLGIIKMPSGFFITAYPCILEAGDVLLTTVGVALTGLIISLVAALKPWSDGNSK